MGEAKEVLIRAAVTYLTATVINMIFFLVVEELKKKA